MLLCLMYCAAAVSAVSARPAVACLTIKAIQKRAQRAHGCWREKWFLEKRNLSHYSPVTNFVRMSICWSKAWRSLQENESERTLVQSVKETLSFFERSSSWRHSAAAGGEINQGTKEMDFKHYHYLLHLGWTFCTRMRYPQFQGSLVTRTHEFVQNSFELWAK